MAVKVVDTVVLISRWADSSSSRGAWIWLDDWSEMKDLWMVANCADSAPRLSWYWPTLARNSTFSPQSRFSLNFCSSRAVIGLYSTVWKASSLKNSGMRRDP